MAKRALLTLLLASSVCFAQSTAPAKPKPGSVAGTVIRTDNSQPVKKAKLSLDPDFEQAAAGMSTEEALAAFRDRLFESETDATGHFLFSDVPPGQYRIRAEKMGFIASEVGGRTDGVPVTVVAGQPVKDVQIQLRPGGAITGRALNEDGEPMANVTVEAMRYSYVEGTRRLLPVGQAQTNDLGEYRVFNLLPGKYYVRARVVNMGSLPMGARHAGKKPEEAYWPLYYPDAKTPATATRVEVKPMDEQHANFNFVPGQGYRVSGKVMGIPASMTPGNGYGMVMLIDKNGDEPSGTAMISAKDPYFSIGPVPPGEYHVIAFSAKIKEPGSPNQSVENVKMGHVSQEVVAADIPNATVNLTTRTPVQIQGKIRLDPAPPSPVDVRGLFVTFDSADDATEMENAFANLGEMGGRTEPTMGQSTKEGTFEARLGASSGAVQVHLTANGGFEDYYTKSILLGGRDVSDSGIAPASITPGSSLDIVVSPFGARVDGVVLDSNKKPVVGAFVACVPEPKLRHRRDLYITDTTNQQGHYVLRGLRPGSYRLYALDEVDPGAIYSSDFLKPFEDMGESLNVKEKDAVSKDLQVLHQIED